VTLPSGEQFELAAGSQRVVVVEVGGGIREWDGVLLGYGADEMCSSGRGQVLAPWPNRLAGGQFEWEGQELQLPVNEVASGSAIHGLARWANWRAVERDAARVALEHVLHPQPGYPFAVRLRVEYRLAETGLTVQTEAENVGDGACPFGVGHHPYVLAPAGRVDDLLLDGEPIGERQLDETRHDPGGWRVEVGDVAIWADESWPWRQVFTGDLPDIRRRGLAVEPMTCPPQAFRTGEDVIRLEPGESRSGEWGFETA
jgi:aldose 1-epimerase